MPIKMTRDDATIIRNLVNSGNTQTSIAKQLGVHVSTVNRIVKNHTYTDRPKRPSSEVIISELKKEFNEVKGNLQQRIKELEHGQSDLYKEIHTLRKELRRFTDRFDG